MIQLVTTYPYRFEPSAPYGPDPITGQPLSDKSRAVAGALQLLLSLVGLPGIGRIYMGSYPIAACQIGLYFFGILTSLLLIGLPILLGAWLWSVIDGAFILGGRATDNQGRKQR